MKKNSAGVVVAIVVAIAVSAGLLRHRPASPDAASPAATGAVIAAPGASAPLVPQVVSLVAAQVRDVPVVVETSGSVVPVDTVDVRAQTSTTVRQVHVKDGQTVRQGDLLFTLDDRVDRANLDKARQQALKDRATLADAQRQLARSQDLAKQNFIAPSAVDTARAAVEAAQAAVSADEAAVQAAAAALSYDQVRAPLAGRAGLVNVNVGALVSPTSTPLVTLSRLDPVAVQFTVAEAEVPALLQGLKGGATVHALPGAGSSSPEVAGRLVFVDNAIDATTGTIKAKAQFANAQQQLWPGQFVRVRLVLRTLAGAVVIPQAAVIERGAERGVYVAGPDGRAQWRLVTPLQADGDLVAVDGLRAGERVVVEGKQNVRPGSPLKAAPAKAAANGGANGGSGTSGRESAS